MNAKQLFTRQFESSTFQIGVARDWAPKQSGVRLSKRLIGTGIYGLCA